MLAPERTAKQQSARDNPVYHALRRAPSALGPSVSRAGGHRS